MPRPFEIGERVTWKTQDHGKEKKMVGAFQGSKGSTAYIDVDGKRVSTLLARLNRCRGRKLA